ncbi:Long chain acyl-CoA synthetase 7, peroxisomal [Smittium culicis]|uniref:Long chain acyl-CoA synthetase 7, peroxisomal n=1 Tax=Smittium culicis TaxID=133412 RepID=A0A1R1YM10_9FUNG|nr:Long chain acyl-CoA synthetase 7, peroxisomal [Smittium culicis]
MDTDRSRAANAVAVLRCAVRHARPGIDRLLMNIDKYPHLKIIISMDPLSNSQTVSGVPVFMPSPYNTGSAEILRSWAKTKNVALHDIHEVEKIGSGCPIAHHPPGPEDTYTMLYTSGTTGNPKGAVNTHANYSAAAIAVMSGRGEYKKTISAVSFMPLAHTSGRNAENSITYKQGFIGYYSGDITRILEDNQKLQPTLFTGVPRLYNRFYDLIASKTINTDGLVGSASRYAASVKINNLLKNNEYDHFLFDRMFFNKTKAMISKNLEYAITGSAPIEAHVLNFLRISLKAKMMDFYGMTETSSVALGQNDTDLTVSNSGIPSDGMEFKLRDVPDMDYLVTNSPHPRGEVLIRGPTVFKGYFKDVEKTNETLIGDGWIATGDIGRINSDGTISIIDRKKALFKLSQGEYVAPEKVENTITKNPLIMQALVYGISTKDHVVSVVVPDELSFVPWATSLLLSNSQNDSSSSLTPAQIKNLSLKQLTKNKIVHSNLLKSIQETCRSSKLNGVKINNLLKNNEYDHFLFDRMFFNKTKAMISKNLEYAITGSAPIEAHVLNFLRISLKAKMMDFYGMTETSSVALGQNDTDLTVSNSGIPSDGMEFKLRDVPDMDYLVTNSPHPRGEVLIRGPTVFKGYFKDVEKTNETLIGDGWIATGDIGRINSDGTISIIDRKKALFKLSQGEYVAPEKVENTITKNPLIMQALVYGISTKDHVVSVVVPDELSFVPWATSLLLSNSQNDSSSSLTPAQIKNLSLKQLTENKIVHSNLLKSIQETCRSSKLNGYEIVKAIHIEHVPFDVETNKLITPTFKLKRFDAAKYYKPTLDRLYNLD